MSVGTTQAVKRKRPPCLMNGDHESPMGSEISVKHEQFLNAFESKSLTLSFSYLELSVSSSRTNTNLPISSYAFIEVATIHAQMPIVYEATYVTT